MLSGTPIPMKFNSSAKRRQSTKPIDEKSTINPMTVLKVKTHISTQIFKIDQKFLILRFFVDFNNLKTTVKDVSIDMN